MTEDLHRHLLCVTFRLIKSTNTDRRQQFPVREKKTIGHAKGMHANGGKSVLTKKAHNSRIFTDRLHCRASASQNFDSFLAGSVATTQQKKRFNGDERGQLP